MTSSGLWHNRQAITVPNQTITKLLAFYVNIGVLLQDEKPGSSYEKAQTLNSNNDEQN